MTTRKKKTSNKPAEQIYPWPLYTKQIHITSADNNIRKLMLEFIDARAKFQAHHSLSSFAKYYMDLYRLHTVLFALPERIRAANTEITCDHGFWWLLTPEMPHVERDLGYELICCTMLACVYLALQYGDETPTSHKKQVEKLYNTVVSRMHNIERTIIRPRNHILPPQLQSKSFMSYSSYFTTITTIRYTWDLIESLQLPTEYKEQEITNTLTTRYEDSKETYFMHIVAHYLGLYKLRAMIDASQEHQYSLEMIVPKSIYKRIYLNIEQIRICVSFLALFIPGIDRSSQRDKIQIIISEFSGISLNHVIHPISKHLYRLAHMHQDVVTSRERDSSYRLIESNGAILGMAPDLSTYITKQSIQALIRCPDVDP